jgi:HTH-type transcriptional regulator/antitoxin HigA
LTNPVEEFTYEPDYAVPPGQILDELLETRKIRKGELANKCGLSAKTVSLIIGGKAPITPETAIQLERVIGVPARTWNNLEANYRLFQTKQSDRKQLVEYKEWLEQLPIKHLIKRGIIQQKVATEEMVEQLLTFFGVGNVKAWYESLNQLEVSFRRSTAFRSSPESVMTWLRIGELRGSKVPCASYNKTKFVNTLRTIRDLNSEGPDVFEPQMKNLCAKAGVAVVFVGELPNAFVCGATRWLRSDKALILLSLRYKTDDQFWFSFFHEAGHIVLHGKKKTFIDEMISSSNKEEDEANQFASDLLIPPARYKNLLNQNRYTAFAIRSFAQELNIAPGIIVGRLQHDEIITWQSPLNHLKRKFNLIEEVNWA